MEKRAGEGDAWKSPTIYGRLVHGDGRGRILVSTANIQDGWRLHIQRTEYLLRLLKSMERFGENDEYWCEAYLSQTNWNETSKEFFNFSEVICTGKNC
jgi:hypothetical protein